MPQTQGDASTAAPVALTFEPTAGLNTATMRSGVPDQFAYWLDGFMPLANRNFRTLYGIGSALYTATGGETIVCFYFYNISTISYVIIFLSDGSAVQVNTLTGSATTVLAAGTILNPSITDLGISQWGEQYLLICANQPNGYWVWDGSVSYTAGSLAPGVTITNVGFGYTSVPAVLLSGGHGYGATAAASIANGQVVNIVLTNAGQGYLATDTPTVTISGGTSSGSGATFSVSMGTQAAGSGGSVSLGWSAASSNADYISSVSITGGSNYYFGVTASWSYAAGGNPSKGWGYYGYGTPPAISVSTSGGAITGVTIQTNEQTEGGQYITTWNTSTGGPVPSIVISSNAYYYVSSVTVTNGGTNYAPGSTIAASGGGSPLSEATMTLTIVSGVITAVTVTYGGIYGVNSAPSLTVTSTPIQATATVSLMPFGIQGTAVQTYAGHVWVFDGTVYNFSAPGSVSNFATSAGGGSQQSSVSYLRVAYTQAVSTNGFLFLLGDSSMDYISGVQTTTPSGGSPTTTFSQNNSDPEQGTPFPACVTTLGQEILMANSTGIYTSAGGAFGKISEVLDGVFNTVPNFGGLQLSTAKATIFGKRVWMVLVPIIDPITGAPATATSQSTSSGSTLTFSSVPASVVNGMLAYDATTPGAIPAGTTVTGTTGTTVTLSNSVAATVNSGDTIYFFVQKLLMVRDNKKVWWTSLQDVALTFISGQEINSVYIAWGTDGTHLYPLFQQPSTAFAKTMQSKWWEEPGGYETNKAASLFWSLWHCYNTSNTNFVIEIDGTGIDGGGVQYTNTQPYTITGPSGVGHFVSAPQAIGQQGVQVGMTITTTAADMAFISARIQDQIVQFRG